MSHNRYAVFMVRYSSQEIHSVRQRGTPAKRIDRFLSFVHKNKKSVESSTRQRALNIIEPPVAFIKKETRSVPYVTKSIETRSYEHCWYYYKVPDTPLALPPLRYRFLTLSSTYSSRFSNKKKKEKEGRADKRRTGGELARRDLTENERLSEVIRHLEALMRRKSSNSLASSLRGSLSWTVKVAARLPATISAVKPRHFSSRWAKVNLPRSQIGWDLKPASGYIRAGCDGARSRGLDRRRQRGRTGDFFGDSFPRAVTKRS